MLGLSLWINLQISVVDCHFADFRIKDNQNMGALHVCCITMLFLLGCSLASSQSSLVPFLCLVT